MSPKQPYTILYVHSSDEMYGADLILLQLVERLDQHMFRPVVVLPTDVVYQGLLGKALVERQVKTIHLKTAILRRKYLSPWGFVNYLFHLVTSTAALVRIIQRESVDIVHSNTAAVIPGAIAARMMRKRHIWHIHEIIISPRFLWRLTSWLLPRLSDIIVAVSGPTRDHLSQGDRKNAGRAIVIHNGINLDRFNSSHGLGRQIREEWGIAPEAPLIGMVGRISHWKGQDYFLRVAQRVLRAHPEARFALVGGTFPGHEKLKSELQALAAELNLLSATIISDFRSDIPAVLDAFDVFVLPSTLPDPFPTVILEAMAAAKPVVANAHGGCTEMIVDGQTGFLVPPNQIDRMANAIDYLIDHPKERTRMGHCGRQRIEAEFSVESFVRNWTGVYNQLINLSK